MAISVYSSCSLDALADELAASLNREPGDPFRETLLLTPNLPLQRWLTYQLAERRGITANMEFHFIEEGLWRFAESIATLPSPQRNERIKRELIQWMIVGAMLSIPPKDDAFAPLFAYTGPLNDPTDRAAIRKLWQLAEQLSRLFREYENAAPELIRTWLSSASDPRGAEPMWKAQRALYCFLFSDNGLRERLSSATGVRYQTAAEFTDALLKHAPVDAEREPMRLRVFGVPALGRSQMDLLERLSEFADIEIYYLDVLAGSAGQLGGLVSRWGRAHSARREWLIARESKRLPAPDSSKNKTRLAHLRRMLRGEDAAAPVKDDASLELLACPGVRREVEAVRDAVVHLLETEKDLQLTDIGILVPDMTQYRPHIEAVFQRDDLNVPFNLSDTTAEDDSVFAQGVEALMALASGRFTRKEFFNLALNPCFLAAQKLSRDDVMQWLDWADRLNVFREFDAGARADLQPFSWRHALRRLRLGRIMASGTQISAYQKAVPFGDLRSGNPEAVASFSATVEYLARFCERCGTLRSAADWSDLLQSALDEFVAVPEDRSEEEPVRSELFRALNEFRDMDAILALSGAAPARRTLALPLLRELVSASIADVPSRYGHYLLDGVTIGALRADRPIPFRVVFALGLGEGIFPGHDATLSLDVRDPAAATSHLPSAVEANRAALLETLVSARERIVFSYVAQNLQKDETFEPSALLKELSESAPEAALVRTEIPYTASSERYLLKPAAETQPALPCYRRQDLERVLNRLSGDVLRAMNLKAADKKRLQALQKMAAESAALKNFDVSETNEAAPAEFTVTIDELARFLRDPLSARLQRHLGLYDDDREDARALEEHEPFFSDSSDTGRLIRDALEHAVVKANVAPIPETASAATKKRFEDQQFLGDSPSGLYGRLDLSRLEDTVNAIVEKPSVCERLTKLKRVASVSIGKTKTSTASAHAFPTLELTLPNSKYSVKISGQIANVYRSSEEGPIEFLTVSNGTHTSSLPSVFLTQQWLFGMCLSASDARAWMGDAGFVTWLLAANGLKGWAYAALPVAEARAYLARLAADYLDATRFENMPLEPVLKICEREPAHTPPPDFTRRLQQQLERAEDSQYGYSPPAFFHVLNAEVPGDAAAIFDRRIAPFLAGVEEKADGDGTAKKGGRS